MTHIVFLTLFLGLVSGTQTVALRVDGEARSIKLFLDGKEVAGITHAPWSTELDFGPLKPHVLVAVCYDSTGSEVARARQSISLPRPPAEVQILARSTEGHRVAVELQWEHRERSAPQRSTLLVDDRKVALDRDLRATLPPLDETRPHVVAAKIVFVDGSIARSEIVLDEGAGAGYVDTSSSELTAIVVDQPSRLRPRPLDRCFSTPAGGAIRVSTHERSKAHVFFVKDPDPTDALSAFHLNGKADLRRLESHMFRELLRLDSSTMQQLFYAFRRVYVEAGRPAMSIIPRSVDYEARDAGVPWMLTRPYGPEETTARHFADAVAAAGVAAASEGNRRAVVLLLSEESDSSQYDPVTVRRYLRNVGVPLRVWSQAGPRPDLTDSWGEIEDVSTEALMLEAICRLDETVANQHVVWLAADPFTAVNARVDPACGIVSLAAP